MLSFPASVKHKAEPLRCCYRKALGKQQKGTGEAGEGGYEKPT